MFDLTYHKYILNAIKNTLCPNIDNNIYNHHITYLINRKSANNGIFQMNAKNDFTTYIFCSYEYLNKYINEYIKYFNLDTTLYMKLYKYNMVIE